MTLIPSKFFSTLQMEEVCSDDGQPLKNRDGKQLYRLTEQLLFFYSKRGLVITVPIGFITDLDSTPRWPIVYLLLNGFGDAPAVVHDYLYSTGALTRAESDAVLREACLVTGVPGWKVQLVYAAVRVGGSGHYSPSS